MPATYLDARPHGAYFSFLFSIESLRLKGYNFTSCMGKLAVWHMQSFQTNGPWKDADHMKKYEQLMGLYIQHTNLHVMLLGYLMTTKSGMTASRKHPIGPPLLKCANFFAQYFYFARWRILLVTLARELQRGNESDGENLWHNKVGLAWKFPWIQDGKGKNGLSQLLFMLAASLRFRWDSRTLFPFLHGT